VRLPNHGQTERTNQFKSFYLQLLWHGHRQGLNFISCLVQWYSLNVSPKEHNNLQLISTMEMCNKSQDNVALNALDDN